MKNFGVLAKIALLVFVSAVTLNLRSPFHLSLVLSISGVAIFFVKKKHKFFARAKSLVPAGIIIFVLQAIIGQGDMIAKLSFSYVVFSKLIIISLLVLFFTTYTSPGRIVSAFFFLGENIRIMLTMTFYFIPLIYEEARYIAAVQKSRGLGSSRLNIAPLVVPLLHRIFLRAQALSLTIVSRGYEG